MNRFRIAGTCFVGLLFLPLACLAQSPAALPDPSAVVVSVHGLRIPHKAWKACDKGTRRLAAHDAAGSISDFETAIRRDPDFYECYAELGSADFQLQRWDDAESAFRKSLDLSGGRYAPADFGLALIQAVVRRQLADAEQTARAGLRIDSTDAMGNFELAWVLYSTDRFQEAELYARAAVASLPDFAAARLLLAKIHTRENNLGAVLQDFDGYLALDPPGPRLSEVRDARAEVVRQIQSRYQESALSGALSR